jgi:hypothetical protein
MQVCPKNDKNYDELVHRNLSPDGLLDLDSRELNTEISIIISITLY